MIDIIKVYEYGKAMVGNEWSYKTMKNLNRLYYIHSEGGKYIYRDKEYDFIPEMLYFIPYTANITPKSIRVPMIHSYADFELIPPITADEPIICSPNTDVMTNAACSMFLTGAEQAEKGMFDFCDISDKQTELCFSAVKYLTVHISELNGFFPVDDDVIIEVLEYMMKNLSKDLKISNVAKYFFMNEDTFIRRFSKSVRMTPYAWLKSTRIKTAESLMKRGVSLNKAAEKVGYSDSSALLHAIRNRK